MLPQLHPPRYHSRPTPRVLIGSPVPCAPPRRQGSTPSARTTLSQLLHCHPAATQHSRLTIYCPALRCFLLKKPSKEDPILRTILRYFSILGFFHLAWLTIWPVITWEPDFSTALRTHCFQLPWYHQQSFVFYYTVCTLELQPNNMWCIHLGWWHHNICSSSSKGSPWAIAKYCLDSLV